MAGAGYKLFNTGDVLTAAQVNTYLQEQTVMVFASSAARTTALTGVLAEGMISYLTDTDLVQYYNGTAWTTINTDQTPLTTKGDLFTFSTQDARLAVGNNGETLVADSSASTGLRYNPPVGSLANPIINGGMDIAQRGTSFTGLNSSVFTLDRWKVQTPSNNATVTQDTADVPSGFRYVFKFAATGTLTGYAYQMGQQIEFNNCYYLQNKTVTISFYAKAANSNAASTNCILRTRTIAGVDGVCLFTGAAVDNSVNITTSWARYAVTLTLPSSFGSFSVEWVNANSAASGDGFSITGFQIDLGTWTASTAPAFRRSGNTLAGELAACQRYFCLYASGTTVPVGIGANQTATQLGLVLTHPVEMRTVPTISQVSGTNYYAFFRDGANDLFNSFTMDIRTTRMSIIYNNTEISGTSGQAGTVNTNNAATFLALQAEL